MPATITRAQVQPLPLVGAIPLPRARISGQKPEARDINGFSPAHAAHLERLLADMNAGRNFVYHDLVEVDEDA
jgi:hypothetical protein